MYPIPDDVALIKTEEIVRYGRCEMRAAVIDRIAEDKERLRQIIELPEINHGVRKWLEGKKISLAMVTRDQAVMALVVAITEIVETQQEENRQKYDKLHKEAKTPREFKKKLRELQAKLSKQLTAKLGRAQEFRQYLDVAVVYEFDFEITEENETTGNMAFKLPTVAKTIDANASAALLLTRRGKRTFKTQDRWGKLVSQEKLCSEFAVARRNVLYPLGGSIGVDRVVTTFTDLIDQGGSKESFVDALVFTTDISGEVNASIKLTPVPKVFRLVSAGVHHSGSRVDVHKLTLSLVFPKPESNEAIYGVDRFDGDLEEPFDRPADWRARYNLCVADARGREDTLKQLRLTAPEIYCIEYADYFDYQYNGKERSKPADTARSGGTPAIRSLEPQGDQRRRQYGK
jgi:hypothetical protein